MKLKILHLKSHIIHICLLTEFEIFFYIYYVMPYERSIFEKLISTKDLNIPNLDNILNLNITYFDHQNSKCTNYQKQLDDDNTKLFNYCYTYIVIINVVLLMFFIYDLFKTYCLFIVPNSPKYNSKSSLVSFNSFTMDYKKNDDMKDNVEDDFELVDIEQHITRDINNPEKPEKPEKIEKPEKQIRSSYFIIYYWNNSGFVNEFIKTIEFIILIGIFEYCFFKFIVNKFKIANTKTIMCNILKQLNNK
jgi:hypothetical protein